MKKEILEKARRSVEYGSKAKGRPLVIILMGLPGVGKSYLSYHLHEKYGFTIFSGESITLSLFGSDKCKGEDYAQAYSALRELSREAVNKGYNLVIDSTNVLSSQRAKYYEEIGPGADYVVIHLVAPDELSLHRAQTRGVDRSNLKRAKSGCSEETFMKFKSVLEHCGEDELSFRLESDESLLTEVDKIIKEFISD